MKKNKGVLQNCRLFLPITCIHKNKYHIRIYSTSHCLQEKLFFILVNKTIKKIILKMHKIVNIINWGEWCRFMYAMQTKGTSAISTAKLHPNCRWYYILLTGLKSCWLTGMKLNLGLSKWIGRNIHKYAS